MPYRLNPTNKKEVQILRGDTWRTLKIHKTPEKAKRHLKRLNASMAKERAS